MASPFPPTPTSSLPAATTRKSADKLKCRVCSTSTFLKGYLCGHSRIRSEGAPAEPGAPGAQPQVPDPAALDTETDPNRHRRERQGRGEKAVERRYFADR